MLRFNAASFTATIARLALMQVLLENAHKPLVAGWKDTDLVPPDGHLSEQLNLLLADARSLEASLTTRSLERMIDQLKAGTCTYEELYTRLMVVHGRIHDELDDVHMYVIDREHAPYLVMSAPFGDGVADKFPSANYDIVEAARCYGLRRSTACVMHLMRALEVGLAVMGKPLNVETANKNWHNVLDQMEKAIKAMNSDLGPTWKEDQAFYSGAASHFRLLKDGLRNHAMHVREKYTEEQAEEIYRSARAFMRHLAAKLSEPKEGEPA